MNNDNWNKGGLSITSCHSTGRGDFVRITLHDRVSRCQALEIEISHEEFSRGLFALARRPCTFWLNQRDPIARGQPERKTVLIRIRRIDYSANETREQVAREALAPHETDGWAGNLDDALNHHRIKSSDAQSATHMVTFRRFVPVTQEYLDRLDAGTDDD